MASRKPKSAKKASSVKTAKSKTVFVKAVKKIAPPKPPTKPTSIKPPVPQIEKRSSDSGLLDLIKQPAMRELLTLSGGHDSIPLIETMLKYEQGELDTTFATNMELKVTMVRALLNRLHYKGLVEYTRTKDENSGWYTYKWFVRKDAITKELHDRVKGELERHKEKKQMNENHLIFSCPSRCHKVIFEIAAEYAFKCPDCAQEMNALDTEAEARELSNRIQELEQHLGRIKGFQSAVRA